MAFYTFPLMSLFFQVPPGFGGGSRFWGGPSHLVCICVPPGELGTHTSTERMLGTSPGASHSTQAHGGSQNHGAALPPAVPHTPQPAAPQKPPGSLCTGMLSCSKQVRAPKLGHGGTKAPGSHFTLPSCCPNSGRGGSSSCWGHLTSQQQIWCCWQDRSCPTSRRGHRQPPSERRGSLKDGCSAPVAAHHLPQILTPLLMAALTPLLPRFSSAELCLPESG